MGKPQILSLLVLALTACFFLSLFATAAAFLVLAWN